MSAGRTRTLQFSDIFIITHNTYSSQMFGSFRLSIFFLKLGLAAVFLWFGVDKLIHPSYWLNAWVPQWFLGVLAKFGTDGIQFIYANGIFEILVGASLLSGILVKFFSFLAVAFLLSVILLVGLNEVIVRDIGLLGGLLALLFLPNRSSRF